MDGNADMIPSTLVSRFKAQIAGHGSENDGHRSFLKHDKNGRLLKPLQAPPKGQRETAFYKQINESQHQVDVEFRNWIPRFYGITRLEEDGSKYLMLEDLTESFKVPNVMDIKVGSKTYGPDASESKKNQEDAKYVGTRLPFGFSVGGLIVHDFEDLKMTRFDKNFGRELKTDEVHKIPETFFAGRVIPEVVELLVAKMRELLKLYERQTAYHTYASSLLFLYDVDAVKRSLHGGNSHNKSLEKSVDLKLIDFAHVFPAEGKIDENFLFGLKNLISVFEHSL